MENENIINKSEYQSLPWGGVTDVAKHNPENFRYLVHAINPQAKKGAFLTLGMQGVNIDKETGNQSINIFDQPERLDERVTLSMSLIDQDHTSTWGNAGIIVKSPEENIMITSTQDAGAINNDAVILKDMLSKEAIVTGDILLNNTSPENYNEVVAMANTNGSKIQLAGFFYKILKSGEPCDKYMAEKVKSHASRLGLPVVTINTRGNYLSNNVTNNDSELSLHSDGSRYLLLYKGKPEFTVYCENGDSHFMSPEEARNAIECIVQSGESNNEGIDLIHTYESVDRLRQTPKVVFKKDGTIDEVVFSTGYGLGEERSSISSDGHGWHRKLALSREEARRAMLTSGFRFFERSNLMRSITLAEADVMIDIACAVLDKEKSEYVKQWFSEHRQILECQNQYSNQTLIKTI